MFGRSREGLQDVRQEALLAAGPTEELHHGLLDGEVTIDDDEGGEVLAQGGQHMVGRLAASLAVDLVVAVPRDGGGADELGVDRALRGDLRPRGDESLWDEGGRVGPNGKGWPDRPKNKSESKASGSNKRMQPRVEA